MRQIGFKKGLQQLFRQNGAKVIQFALMTVYHKSVTRHKVLTTLTLIVFSASIMVPLAFGKPKPIAFLPELTIERIRPQVDSRDNDTLRLMHLLNVTVDIVVAPGGDVQAAINSAQLGDTIILQAGATYTGPYTLPVKSGTGQVTIKSSRTDELPPNVRVTPAQAPLLAWLQSREPAAPVIKTAPGAHGYKFIGIRVSTADGSVAVYDIVRFGDGKGTQKTVDTVPRDISFDRGWVHGWLTQNSQAGITVNSADSWVTNSYINEIHSTDVESQAVRCWNGCNGVHVLNNYLEAAGENVMVGGADSASPDLIPANIEIRRNHLFKPLSWKVGDPSYAGKQWIVKNLLELKSARNVTIDGNVMENIWVQAQDGSAVLLTVRNQECTAPWSTVQDVVFTNNTVRGASGAALNFLGMDNEATIEYVTAHPDKCNLATAKLGSVRGANVSVKNNLFHDIKGAFLQLNGFNNVVIDPNTHLQNSNTMTLFGQISEGFVYRNNVTSEKAYGIFGDGGLIGKAALDKWTPGYVFTGNFMAHPPLADPWYGSMPAGNEYPLSVSIDGNFRTPYAGKGANIDGLIAAQGGTSNPTPTPTPSVTPTPTPTPSPSPSPSPSVTPTPTPTPTPSPTPPICTMTVSSPTLPQWSSGKVVVNLSGLSSPAMVTATQASGQVTVDWPTSRSISGSSAIIEFGVQTKKKASGVIISGPCGSKAVMVNVQ